VLDLGCGIGLLDRELEPHVGALIGVDVSLPSLQLAAGRAPATAFAQYDGARLPFADGTFGCAVASCVLHHVMPAARAGFIGEMMRVLTPGGLAVIIEHNARNPVTRHIVSRCAFDADAVLLTRQEAVTLLADGGVPVAGWRYLGFLPFRNRIVERAERLVGWLPAGAQYCVWGRKCTNA
jgi:ubiquinone/menaquinone biosynthesis C-methylase UbiE